MVIRSYKDLDVWNKSMDLVVECYTLTRQFPKSEVYGLNSQIQRAAVSIPANIAEGRQRQHSREFSQHLSIASGSLAELETHVQIANRLDYLRADQIKDILDKTTEIGKMLNGVRKSIKSKSKS